MPLNPISFTQNVVGDFLRYQLTAYPFADEHLQAQMRQLLSLSEALRSPLVKGPYISLSRAFKSGVPIRELIDQRAGGRPTGQVARSPGRNRDLVWPVRRKDS